MILVFYLGPPYAENSRAKNSSFFAKSRASFTLHGTKTRVLSKNSSFQVAKVDNLTNSKCQVVDFCDQKNSSFEIPKMPQRVLASRHNVCFMFVCVLTSWILWSQHTLFGSCGRSVCFLFLQFVAPILIFVVECDSRRLYS